VTLIAAFRSPKGIALCADSQETVSIGEDQFRATVQKITPFTAGKYQIAIAGSANDASLIEAFFERARRLITDQDGVICTQQNPASISIIRRILEEELERFHARGDVDFKLFVAASCPIAQEYALWVSENIILREARSPELIGWEKELYSETASRLFAENMTLPQAVLASIYVLTVATATSNFVRNPLSVAVISKDGIWIEDAEYIRLMADRLDDYEVRMNRLFLACADTAVSVPELEDRIEEFKKSAIDLHREHINQQAAVTNIEQLFSNSPLKKLPMPLNLSANGDLTAEHDRDKINQTRERWEELIKMTRSHPLFFKCRNCGTEIEYNIEETDGGTLISHSISGRATSIGVLGEDRPTRGSLECPNCKTAVPTPAKVTRYRQIGPTEGMWIEIEIEIQAGNSKQSTSEKSEPAP